VSVQGGKDPTDGGGIYFVDVQIRKASLFERVFPFVVDSSSSVVPTSAVNSPGLSGAQQHTLDSREMARSQSIAAAVALRQLGYKVRATEVGALIEAVAPDGPAAGELLPTDVVITVDGQPVRTPSDLRRLLRRHRPGDSVRIGVRRGGSVRSLVLRTIPSPTDPTRPLIGVVVSQAAQVRLPIAVRIDIGNVVGPSAGLAFALDVLEELGRDVDHGRRIAATGTIELDGSVGPIGGIKQKTIGARRSKVDAFLVPAGDNAREARRYAHGLRIVAVSSFQQALHELATLPSAGR
jgi:PDZ domain-containing protein